MRHFERFLKQMFWFQSNVKYNMKNKDKKQFMK